MALHPILGAVIGGCSVGVIMFTINRIAAARDKRTKLTADEAARLAAEVEHGKARIAELESRLNMVDKIVEPFWTAAQKKLVGELTHYHKPRLDALLAKLGPPNIQTPAECEEMGALLAATTETLNGRIDDDEKDAAMILPAVIRKAQREITKMQDPATPPAIVQLVTTQPTTEEKPKEETEDTKPAPPPPEKKKK